MELTEAQKIMIKYDIKNMGSLTIKDREKIPTVEEQFKVAFHVWKHYKYRCWNKDITYLFWQNFHLKIYMWEYCSWLRAKNFKDFVNPIQLPKDLWNELKQDEHNMEYGTGKEKFIEFGGLKLSMGIDEGRPFQIPRPKFREYWKLKDKSPKCPKCGSTNTKRDLDGKMHCLKCGHK